LRFQNCISVLVCRDTTRGRPSGVGNAEGAKTEETDLKSGDARKEDRGSAATDLTREAGNGGTDHIEVMKGRIGDGDVRTWRDLIKERTGNEDRKTGTREETSLNGGRDSMKGDEKIKGLERKRRNQ
jgi:hypothetical protein